MSQKLPPDFDAQRYLAAYPDVALSGLDPAAHYLRFGRLLGRSPAGRVSIPTVSAPKPRLPEAESKAEDAPVSAPSKWTSVKPSPIIDRPVDFDPVESVPAPAPPRGIADKDGNISLEALSVGPFQSSQERARLCGALADYALLVGLTPPPDTVSVPRLQAGEFASGETRIESAWYAGGSWLRLMIAGGKSHEAASKGWVLRAYQALSASPNTLREAGQGVQLPASGPIFHDIELAHPLMPVLLELADAEGFTRGLSLLPFPSLLPGGIHGAELKALQTEANPMDAFWSLSETFLREHLGKGDWPAHSIKEISWGEDPPPLDQLQEWIACIFGLPGGRSSSGGLTLVLPTDCVPTIGVLVSRRLELDTDSAAIAPFLVVDPSSWRPRWSVALPAGSKPDPGLPVISAPNGASALQPSPKCIPIHAAIALRSADPLEAIVDTPAPDPMLKGLQLTIVLDANDPVRTGAVVQVLRDNAPDGETDFLVRSENLNDGLSAVLDKACGKGGWTATEADVAALARGARHEWMLTLSDRVELEAGALSMLLGLLRENEDAASAAAVLLGEKRIRKQAILQTATGGLFPAAVSFARSPQLSFFEPDVLQPLPNSTYGVVANTLLCTAWRTRALAAVPPTSGPIPEVARDIHLGLDLMRAGYRNLCTTRVHANFSGAYARRDAIDPVGSLYLRPGQWEEILSRVTVLRELY